MSIPTNGPRVHDILTRLVNVKTHGGYWTARCPGHDDQVSSLSIREGDDGRILLKCFTGCTVEQILQSAGMTWADLFNPDLQKYKTRVNGHTYEHIRRNNPDGTKQVAWVTDGKPGLLGAKLEDFPLYGSKSLEEAPDNSTVYVCEGEKSAQALIDLDILAVGTVTGASGTPTAAVLAPLIRHKVVLWPDNDQPGIDHMNRIAALLNMRRPPLWLEWPTAPPKGDAADYVAQGLEVAALPALTRPWRPQDAPAAKARQPIRIVNAVDLMASEFQPPRWAVPELLMEGLCLLAGRPKLGKSWLGLNVADSVASGRLALGKIKTIPGDVLYMALEDGERRMQERLASILGERQAPPLLHFAYEWPKFDEEGGGLAALSDWIDDHPNARLIVIDTFKRVRPAEKGGAKRLYDLDYDALAPLAALARDKGVAIIVVFHARKGEADDPLDLVSGTTGLSGACDAVFVLRRERGQADASLFVTGRDIEERDMALRWHGDQSKEPLWWEWIGEASDFRVSAERLEILDVIKEMPGCKPNDIAGAVGKTGGAIRYLLFRMVRDSQVRLRNGAYFPAEEGVSLSPSSSTSPYSFASPPANANGRVGHPTQPPPVRGYSDAGESPVRGQLGLFPEIIDEHGDSGRRDGNPGTLEKEVTNGDLSDQGLQPLRERSPDHSLLRGGEGGRLVGGVQGVQSGAVPPEENDRPGSDQGQGSRAPAPVPGSKPSGHGGSPDANGGNEAGRGPAGKPQWCRDCGKPCQPWSSRCEPCLTRWKYPVNEHGIEELPL